jgi:RimJ/RimL family protein N-acetyltransferase
MAITRLLVGERIRLTAVRPEDTAVMTRWFEDTEFVRLLDSDPAFPRTEAQISQILNQETGKNAFSFSVRPKDDERLIGGINLDSIMWTHGSAWLGICIGVEFQGQGYGYETIDLALAFAFLELNLHRVQLSVFSYNERAIALYEKLGFVKEGVYREALHRDGKRHDMLLYGILRREWQARRDSAGQS